MDYTTMAHRAMYAEIGEEKSYANCNVWYSRLHKDTHIYSYGTCVAEVVDGKNGDRYTLVSDQWYSVTTCKHVNAIIYASPYMVLHVPTCSTWNYADEFRELLLPYTDKGDRHGNKVKDSAFSKAEERKAFLNALVMFDNFEEYIGGLGNLHRLRHCKRIRHLMELCTEMQRKREEQRRKTEARTEEEKERARQKRKEAIERKLYVFTNGIDANERLRLTFDRHSPIYKEKYVKEYRNNLSSERVPNQWRHYSYMWLAGDWVKTSQGISVPTSDVRRLCTLWKRKQSILGDHAGMYSVVENTPDHVQCGCHVIPTWNIEVMCNALNIN